MKNDRQNRRSIRLQGYDYSQAGAYFVTICTQDHVCLPGDIVEGEMILNDPGRIVNQVWIDMPCHYDNIEIGNFIIMPNHFHGIVHITAPVGAIHELPVQIHELPLQMTKEQRRKMILPRIIGRFKMQSSKKINQIRQIPGQKCWQRNYYEHIIRNDADYQRINEYIKNNPLKWALDVLNPANGANKWKK